jgi:hypothetical protein
MRRILFISALLLFLYVSSFGMAFNNHRRGFIIGGGGGIGLTIWNGLEDDVEVNIGTDFALHADFRIGIGFKGDKLILYPRFLLTSLLSENANEDIGSNLMFFLGIGMSYYFRPILPSLYINAGIGMSTGREIVEPCGWLCLWPNELESGTGFMGGIGYEFAPHWSTEVGIMYSNPKHFNSISSESNIYAITLSIIGIAY